MSSRSIRYGILGFGRFAAKAIAPAIKKSHNSQLVAIQNRSLSKAREAAEEHDVPLAFDSPAEFVAHPEVDAVFILSPNAAHCEETVLAASAGKHVLCEKPMAMNVDECERMIEVCRRGGVKLMVGHMIRLSPLAQRMRDLVRSGGIGRVIRASSDFVYDGRLSTRAWLLDRQIAGGGPTFDVGVHCLDTLRFILDDEVSSVKGELEPYPTSSETESSSHLLLRFSRGTVGSIFSSYDSPLRESRIEILGTEARMSTIDFTVGDRTAELAIEERSNDGEVKKNTEQFTIPNLYVEELNHFSDCILDNSEPVLTGANALANQRVLDAAMHV